eukprot:5496139-Prymnesium_polylepis.1
MSCTYELKSLKILRAFGAHKTQSSDWPIQHRSGAVIGGATHSCRSSHAQRRSEWARPYTRPAVTTGTGTGALQTGRGGTPTVPDCTSRCAKASTPPKRPPSAATAAASEQGA